MRVKSLICPHCRTALQIGDYTHDADLSLKCLKCEKIMFPVTQKQEDEIPRTGGKAGGRQVSWGWQGQDDNYGD